MRYLFIISLIFTQLVLAASVSSTDQKQIELFVKNYNSALNKSIPLEQVFTKSYFTKYGTKKEIESKMSKLKAGQSLTVSKSYKNHEEIYVKLQMNLNGKKERESGVFFVLTKEDGKLKLNGLKGEFSAPVEKEQ